MAVLGALAGVVTTTLTVVGAPVAHAALSVVADYEMTEVSGAVMHDAGPLGLDGTIGSSIGLGVVGGAYHWDYTPPDTPPLDPERLAVVPTDEALNPGTSDFAIEVRYRTTETHGNIFQKGQSSTDGGYWKLEQPDGFPTCLFRRNNSDKAQVVSPKRKNDGAFHTVRCQRDAAGLTMFIDNVQVARNSRKVGAIVNSFPMTIGGKSSCNQANVGCDYFTGDIDYARVEKDVPALPNAAPSMSIDTPSCVELTCTFDSSGSVDVDGTIVDRAWDFGDGATVEHQDVTATHSFPSSGTYTVTLVGTDDDGASSKPATVKVTVVGTPNQPPDVGFTWACDLAVCTFDSSASADPDGTIVSRAWTFGDGTSTTVTAPVVDHTYGTSSSYTVRLVVTDDDGAVNTATSSITVSIPEVQADPGSSRFVPVSPTRVFDTRPGEPGAGPKGVVRGGSSIDVDVTGVAGVPASGVTAVAINIAAIALDAPSFVAARPAGTPEATSSSLNILAPGQVRANLVIVPVGTNGKVTLSSLRDAHLVGDIAGYFVPQGAATTAGRIVTQTPQRLLDTRPGSAPGPKGVVQPGAPITVKILGRAGVPSKGVAAVVLNLTATGIAGPGYVTAYPSGTSKPLASSINASTAGETVANQVIVPVGGDGSIRLAASIATHLVADAVGYVTSASAPVATTGLFVPVAPKRIFDTRPGEAADGPKGLIPAKTTIRPRIGGVAGIPETAGAVALNVTIIGTAPGYATFWPAGERRPVASTVNVSAPGDVRPNGAILRVGDGGDLDAYVLTPAHLLADAYGYFLH